MDSKKSPNRRNKRHSKGIEENYWDCSVCTYRNSAEAFKCLMCDVRKGTSTRKPRINPQLVAQQVAQQYSASQPQVKPKSKPDKEKKGSSSSDSKAAKKIRPRLKNIDRRSGQVHSVTSNNVTVIITEFQPKRRTLSETSMNGGVHSSSSSQSDSSLSDSSDTPSIKIERNGSIKNERNSEPPTTER